MKIPKFIYLLIAVILTIFITTVKCSAQLNYNAKRISADTLRGRSSSQGGTGQLNWPYNFTRSYPFITVNDTLLHVWVGRHGGGGSSIDSTNFWRTKSDFSLYGDRLVTIPVSNKLEFQQNGKLRLQIKSTASLLNSPNQDNGFYVDDTYLIGLQNTAYRFYADNTTTSVYSPNNLNYFQTNDTNVFLRRGNSGIDILPAYTRASYFGGYNSDWTASYFRTGTATENSIYINADSTTIYSPIGDSNGKIKLTSTGAVLLVGADKIHGFSVIEAGLEWGAYSNDLDSLQFAFRHNAPGMSDAAGDGAIEHLKPGVDHGPVFKMQTYITGSTKALGRVEIAPPEFNQEAVNLGYINSHVSSFVRTDTIGIGTWDMNATHTTKYFMESNSAWFSGAISSVDQIISVDAYIINDAGTFRYRLSGTGSTTAASAGGTDKL